MGSGHFLVSALNELIAIKSDLDILADKQGKVLGRWKVSVENDELVIFNAQINELFEYHPPSNKQATDVQTVQETLFAEKQTIIENCLFGVDINPNSVKICRLRLWIELLKNAYYTPQSNYTYLETLPNIDINIKRGNSLVSRFSLTEDLTEVFKKDKYNLQTYRSAVAAYKETTSKRDKDELLRFIKDIKEQFKTAVLNRDPRRKKLADLRGELILVETTNIDLFGDKKLTDSDRQLEVTRLRKLIALREQEIADVENNAIYNNAFEWRFEFPEVLDDDGNYTGFDVVIGNPPYIRADELGEFKNYLKKEYAVFIHNADVYYYFYELTASILRKAGIFCFINNTFDKTTAGKSLRSYLSKNIALELYIDLTSIAVFDEATTYPIIFLGINSQNTLDKSFQYSKVLDSTRKENLISNGEFNDLSLKSLSESTWNFSNKFSSSIDSKFKNHRALRHYFAKTYYGLKTGLNKAFVIDEATKNLLITNDYKSEQLIKPFLIGRDIKRYVSPVDNQYLILVPKGFTIKTSNGENKDFSIVNEPPPRYGNMEYFDAWSWFKTNYPAIANYLLPFKEKAEKRTDKGDFWWELRACDYYGLFQQPKIVFPNLQNSNKFTFDTSGLYLNAPAVFLPTNDLSLLGIINSKLIWHYLKSVCVVRNGGYIEVKPQYFEQIPIVDLNKEKKLQITHLVDQIILAKQGNAQADTTALEQEIDALVYQLYGLTDEEIAIVEGR